MSKTTSIKERPIIFTGDSVRAILEGRKTQTRRVMKPQLTIDGVRHHKWEVPNVAERCPLGKSGDRLWVRETWQDLQSWTEYGCTFTDISTSATNRGRFIEYKATNASQWEGQWRSPLFMPRWAARLTLEIVGVRVERLQEITTADACAEGIPGCREHLQNSHALQYFQILWDLINRKRAPWESNPWVWVLEFRRLSNATTQPAKLSTQEAG